MVFIVVFHILVMHITNQFNKTRYGNNLLRKVFLHIQRDATCRLGSSPGLLTLSFPGSRGWILRIQEDQQINVSKLFNGQHTTINEISNETLDISF